MGDRYFITVICKRCKCKDDKVYYAPTCGFTTWKCPICGLNTDLETYTGISYADASNAEEIHNIIHALGGK
jgi:hypothetical protein